MLTSKQRAFLRGSAQTVSPIFQVGKGGISEEMIKQLDAALEARELIKITVLENSGYAPKDAADEIAEGTGADVVAVTGFKVVLYRPSRTKKNKIELPK